MGGGYGGRGSGGYNNNNNNNNNNNSQTDPVSNYITSGSGSQNTSVTASAQPQSGN
jgi:hypothetical protein